MTTLALTPALTSKKPVTKNTLVDAEAEQLKRLVKKESSTSSTLSIIATDPIEAIKVYQRIMMEN